MSSISTGLLTFLLNVGKAKIETGRKELNATFIGCTYFFTVA
jgi:hypothetical protein